MCQRFWLRCLVPLIALLASFAVPQAAIPSKADPNESDVWPQFRGPDGQGHVSSTLPTTWSEHQHILWTTPIPGKGWSSPVIGKDLVWLTTALPSPDGGTSLRALAVDRASGQLRHNIELFLVAKPDPVHPRNSLASPTPIVSRGRLYAHFGKYGTACVDTQTGSILWKNTDLVVDHETGPASSPALYQDLLLCTCDGSDRQYAAALSTATGKVVWKTERPAAGNRVPSERRAFATPLVIAVGGHDQVIMPGAYCVYSYAPRSGKELWRIRYGGYSNVPRPIFAHGMVYVCTGFAPPQVWAIRPDGQGDVTDTHVVWRQRKNAPSVPSPLIVGDLLFMLADSGIATCLDARSGKVHWAERLPGSFAASLLACGDTVYAFAQDGKTILFKAAPTYQELGRNVLEGRVESTPAAAEGCLYVRTDKRLVKIGPARGIMTPP
jgi:outer membrane protein assembly factor BamB